MELGGEGARRIKKFVTVKNRFFWQEKALFISFMEAYPE
jgi:hypothetical protein